MLKTEHRPVPLPNQGTATPDPTSKPGRRSLPRGATHMSMSYYDDAGKRHAVQRSVPVDAAGRLVAHEYDCPECPDDPPQWLPIKLKTIPYCDVHGIPLTRSDERRKFRLNVPWRAIWDVADERVRVAATATAVGVTGVAVDQADMPWFGVAGQVAAVPAVIAGSWWATRWWLTRRAVKRGTLDPRDEVAGRRRRKLIAKRARAVGYTAAGAAAWVQVADLVGVDFTDPRGPILAAALAGLGVVGSRPYLRYVDDKRGHRAEMVAVPPAEDTPTVEPPSEAERLRAYVTERWARVAGPGAALPGTVLENIHRTVGGWAAIIVAGETSDLDPDKWGSDKAIGMVARAFSVGTNAVSITADPDDANRAHILVQKVSPLSTTRDWDGASIDVATGRAYTATLDDGERIAHEFWRPGWGAVMELIAGCTGSGKSEYLNLLLALERKSGRIVSWVGDPQMGQSLGDVRDGVDWFAPTSEEILTMLRVAVQVMLARNLTITRMRQADEQGRERRVKYREVAPDFPLLSITIDEAHLPMGDPDLGNEIVKLLALLSKSGRKCNVKLRLITQSPLLSELKNSVLRGQLSSGLVTVFRTAGKLDGTAAWPGKMPADPGALPAVWPDGSTAAGVMYQSGQKPIKARTDYPGDLYDLMTTGPTLGLEQPVLGAAGVLYADRRKRLDAFDSLDPAELLGVGVPTIDLGEAKTGSRRRGGGRDAVLRFLGERWADGDREPVPFGEIDRSVDAVKTRALTDVMNRLVKDGLAENRNGAYVLTEAGAEHMGLEVDV